MKTVLSCLEQAALEAISENSSIFSPVNSPSGSFAAAPNPQYASSFTSLQNNAPRLHWLIAFSKGLSGLRDALAAIQVSIDERDSTENIDRSTPPSEAPETNEPFEPSGQSVRCVRFSCPSSSPSASPQASPVASPQASPQSIDPMTATPQVTFTAAPTTLLDASLYPHTLNVEPIGTSMTMYMVSVEFTDPDAHPPLGATLCLTLPTTPGAVQDSDGNDVDLSALPMQHCWTNSVAEVQSSPAPTVDPTDPPTDIQHTINLLNSFITRRADQAIANLPDIANRLNRGGKTGFERSSNFSANYNNGYRTANIDTSFSLGSDIFGGNSSAEGWGDLSYAISEGPDGADTNTLFFTAGVDMLASEDMVIGLMTQLDWSSESGGTAPAVGSNTDVSSTLDGAGWLIGPYLATEISDSLSFASKILFGGSDIEISPLGTYKDDVETSRLLVDVSLSTTQGTPVGEWNLSPKVSYIYYSEESDEYEDGSNPTGSGRDIPSYEYGLNRLDFGPRLSRDFKLSDGSKVTSVLHFSGIFDTSEASTNTPANTGCCRR